MLDVWGIFGFFNLVFFDFAPIREFFGMAGRPKNPKQKATHKNDIAIQTSATFIWLADKIFVGPNLRFRALAWADCGRKASAGGPNPVANCPGIRPGQFGAGLARSN